MEWTCIRFIEPGLLNVTPCKAEVHEMCRCITDLVSISGSGWFIYNVRLFTEYVQLIPYSVNGASTGFLSSPLVNLINELFKSCSRKCVPKIKNGSRFDVLPLF